MPPTGGKSKGNKRGDARSRNTTPISSTSNDQTSNMGDTSGMSYEQLLKEHGSLTSPPPVGSMKKMLESLKAFGDVARLRSETCDKGMREYSKKRKELSDTLRQRDFAAKQAEEDRKQKEQKKNKLRKEQEQELKQEEEQEEAASRPLAVGAHALAPQDGSASEAPAPDIQPPTTEPAQDQQTAKDRRISTVSEASETSHQPRPEPSIPAFQTFGSDPSTFDDPTIYHIRDWTAYNDEEDKKEILGVAEYPHSDLHELTCGTPPDKDLVNAKPTNQVTANQFATYLEPYTKPLTEEDLAFLMERGDRVTPFVIPRRGPKHYKEIWAEEDNGLFGDPVPEVSEQPSAIEANGSLEQMTDEMAETSNISLGPMMSRLLSTLRPIHRPESNGDSTQASGTDGTDADGDVKMEEAGPSANGASAKEPPKPATYFPESSLPGFKQDFPKLSAEELDERLKAQLRYIGFLDENTEPDYESHLDDEVAARLRYLQEELQRVSIINGARKARVREVVEYAVAQQEWMTISDDLDSQLNQAYLKRYRNTGKGKNKLKRPGQPAGVATGVSKPSLGESTRAIMQRRHDWREMIGPVVEYGKTSVPESTIFEPDIMEKLMQEERVKYAQAQESGVQ